MFSEKVTIRASSFTYLSRK